MFGKVYAMSKEFLDAVRDGNWTAAHELVGQGAVSASHESPNSSVCEWLVELNAPPELVADLLRQHSDSETVQRAQSNLMSECLRLSATKSNAFDTFALLLAQGVSPNLIVEGGSTLLQRAMAHNQVREVRELLRHGVDPNQVSIFGLESASNLEEVALLTNEASRVVLEHFRQGDKV